MKSLTTSAAILALVALAGIEAFSPRRAGVVVKPRHSPLESSTALAPASVPVKPHVVQEIRAKKNYFSSRVQDIRRQAFLRSQGLTEPVTAAHYQSPSSVARRKPLPRGDAYFRSRIEECRKGALLRNIEAAKAARKNTSPQPHGSKTASFSPIRTKKSSTSSYAMTSAPSRTAAPQYRRGPVAQRRSDTYDYATTTSPASQTRHDNYRQYDNNHIYPTPSSSPSSSSSSYSYVPPEDNINYLAPSVTYAPKRSTAARPATNNASPRTANYWERPPTTTSTYTSSVQRQRPRGSYQYPSTLLPASSSASLDETVYAEPSVVTAAPERTTTWDYGYSDNGNSHDRNAVPPQATGDRAPTLFKPGWYDCEPQWY